MDVNDFPRLPVIQDKNLLVVITAFKEEWKHESFLHLFDSYLAFKNQMKALITDKTSIILFPNL